MARPHQLKRDPPHGKRLTTHPAQPLADPSFTHAHPLRLEFDFVVAQRAKYIPGSGPPLAPIGILPEHDKYGIIEDFINLEGAPLYVVSYKDHPALRMAIKPEHVRDYVSARTLERWEDQQTEIRLQAERDAMGPRARAKAERRLAKEAGTEARANRPPKKKQQSKRPFGVRKRRRGPVNGRKPSTTSMVGAGMGSGMLPAEFTPGSPVQKSAYISPRRPSTSTPSKQRGLAEAMYSEPESDDGEDTSTALDRQLNGNPSTDSATSSKPSKQNSPSDNKSIRLSILTSSDEFTSKRKRRSTSSASRKATSESDELVDKRRKTFDRKDSIASISSRAALQAYEDLERNATQLKTMSISERLNKPLPPHKLPLKPAQQPKSLSITPSQANKPRFEARSRISIALPILPAPKPARVTKAQANKDRFDSRFGNRATIAIPSRLIEPHSSPRDSPSRRRSERPSSSQDNTPGLRRSERASSPAFRHEDKTSIRRRSARSSSRAPASYVLPPPLTRQDLEPDGEGEPPEPEYEVEAIVGEKWRTINGKAVMFYFIKWHGDWENTWEPAENVGNGSIHEWEKEKRRVEAKRMKAKVAMKDTREDSDEQRPPLAMIPGCFPDSDADPGEI